VDTEVEERKTMDEGRGTRCKDKCKISAKGADAEAVRERLVKALTAFDEIIHKTEMLQIDAFLEKGDPVAGKDNLAEEDGFKVINHDLENAYFVPLSKILEATPEELKSMVIALIDGVFVRVEGVTRIVGYYSRIHNWNTSKRAELEDRAHGNYWSTTRKLGPDTVRALISR
jgi:hypothetical protein